VELWRAGGPNTTATAAMAQAVEADGWDGQMFMDSQSLSADPWVQMGAWAVATERLRLATGVTNPFTRHLAVTAAAAASLQSVSGGRAVLGIGRGDSALAYLNHAPVGLADFERALHDLQALLRGEELAFGADGSLDTLSLGARPESLALRWLPADLPKVPLDVAATGPKVITMAAPVAERVTFSVGAVPERIDWALGVAREARARHGLTDEGISYGAQIVVVCHPDVELATEVARDFAAPFARFQVIQGEAAGPQSDEDAANFTAVREDYDMNRHGSLDERKRLIRGSLTSAFAQRFTIVGGPDQCTERLLDLARRGIDRFFVVGPGFYPPSWGQARDLFTREVMPALRQHVAAAPA
jgi:5,10-methylenetetrahydromethanopterin reductase